MTTAETKAQLWRFGAIALFCGLPLLAIAGIASSVMDATQAADAAAYEQATTTSIVTLLERHRARATTPVDTSSLYLKSVSESLARAEIQERATSMVAQAGGRLAEVQLTGTPEQEAEGIVAIQLSLEIDNKGLLDLLFAVESGLPVLDVADLTAQRAIEQQGESVDSGMLRVEMTLHGHWRKGAG